MIVSKLAAAENFSKQERKAAAFILRNPDFIKDHTAKELAEAAGVSPSTITRLCKDLGVEGFNQFKVEYVAEWEASNGNLYARLSKPLVESSSEEKAANEEIELMSRFYNRVIYEMERLIDPDELDELCQQIATLRKVGLYGTGLNYGACEQAAFKLQTLGIDAQAFTSANIQALEHRPKQTHQIAILTSHTGGASGNMVETATILKRNGIPVAAITPDRSSELGSLSDICIRTFRTSTVDRLSLLAYPISLQYVFDVIYATLLAQELDDMYPNTAREYYAR